MRWHPWRALREREQIIVYWTDDLTCGVLGATDGARVWMARDQLQAERRCTLTHELVHLEWAHLGEQSAAIERAVAVEAARRLIPVEDLVRAAAWAVSVEEAAEELWVDVDTLLVRLENLNENERERLDSFLGDCERGA